MFHPAGHLLRSTVKPSGPRTVFPSGWRPHLFSLIRWTIASRCVFHSASHSSIDVGSFSVDAVVEDAC